MITTAIVHIYSIYTESKDRVVLEFCVLITRQDAFYENSSKLLALCVIKSNITNTLLVWNSNITLLFTYSMVFILYP